MVKFLEKFCIKYWKNRKVHPVLEAVLRWDVYLTQKIFRWGAFCSGKKKNAFYKLLEVRVGCSNFLKVQLFSTVKALDKEDSEVLAEVTFKYACIGMAHA